MTIETLSPRAIAWPSTLSLSTVLGSMALACVFPFAAFATLAALTLSRRAGLALLTAVWAANQAVGFLLLSFPWDGQAVGHGFAILGATLAAHELARLTFAGVGRRPAIGAALALVSAFAGYEALLWAYAQFGGGAENFTAEIVGQIALSDALWFGGLMAARLVLAWMQGERPLNPPAAAAA